MRALAGLLIAAGCLTGCQPADVQWTEPSRPACVAPAKPGGGFDLTCRLAARGFESLALTAAPMQVRFQPGGIGAVAMANVMSSRRVDADSIVAFSAGSVLNIAQGKFGRGADIDAVRWLAAAGVDYGALSVSSSATWQSLEQLAMQLRAEPESIVIGAGGTVGSQDWMKAALLFRALDLSPRRMRYVAFDGGGEAMAALFGDHIQLLVGDVAETVGYLDGRHLRVLAVLAAERLPGALQSLPTALEQGFDIQWPVFRGYYLPKNVSDAQFDWWQTGFNALYGAPEFQALRADMGLQPLDLAGSAFDAYVREQAQRYRALAAEFGLIQ